MLSRGLSAGGLLRVSPVSRCCREIVMSGAATSQPCRSIMSYNRPLFVGPGACTIAACQWMCFMGLSPVPYRGVALGFVFHTARTCNAACWLNTAPRGRQPLEGPLHPGGGELGQWVLRDAGLAEVRAITIVCNRSTPAVWPLWHNRLTPYHAGAATWQLRRSAVISACFVHAMRGHRNVAVDPPNNQLSVGDRSTKQCIS